MRRALRRVLQGAELEVSRSGAANMSNTRLVEVRQKVLNKNDIAARALAPALRRRARRGHQPGLEPGFRQRPRFSSVFLAPLRSRYRVAALVGDLATENDAVRLARSQVPVKQISQVRFVTWMRTWSQLRSKIGIWKILIFCSSRTWAILFALSSYDLGEHARIVLLSVTEGEDKPLKYPTIFNSADVAIITKSDLASAVEFSWERVQRNIQSVRPGMVTFPVSAKTGHGMCEVMGWMEDVFSRRNGPTQSLERP